MSRDVNLLLSDIEDACEDVAKIVGGVDYEAFAASIEKVAAIERKLFVIGEAVSRLPNDFRDRHDDVPWKAIIGMRNILAHAYWQIDPKILWDAATRSVVDLKAAVVALRST